MRSSVKHSSPIGGVIAPPVSGVNLALPPHLLAETELANATNWWLSPYGEVEGRPGTIEITDTAFPSAVTCLYSSPALGLQFITSGVKLYVLDTDGSHSEVGDLSGVERPQIIDFNGVVYVASGGPLQTYDGTVFSLVTTIGTNPIPEKAIALAIYDARLFVANSGSKICWSGANDAGDWGGTAELSGGYGYLGEKDGGDVSGLSVCQGRLYAYKSMDRDRQETYRIVGNTGSYEVKKISEGSGASVNATICPFLSDVLFFGGNGVQKIQMVEQYGDARAFPVSLRIDPMIQNMKTPHSAIYSPSLGYYLLGSGPYIAAWHSGQGSWWPWYFTEYEPSCLGLSASGEVLIGTTHGHVYSLDYKQDEGERDFTDGGEPLLYQMITRAIDFGVPDRNKIWKWLSLIFLPQTEGSVAVDLRKDYGTKWKKSTAVATQMDVHRLTGWDEAFCWDNSKIGWDQGSLLQRRIRMIFRSQSVQISIFSRAHLRWMSMNIEAAVLGRDGTSWRA